MMHISRIKMRGFKSFKFADITMPKDYVCLAGPNGSGKSNICDALRFAFGETSLKNLRAKRAKELISHNAKMAEVTVYIDGDERHEIKRAIRDDGKIMYRLDGERATRTSILDLLKKFNVDESGRNTIAQGEVNRIVDMSPKARREIIDSVAGISEFEDKKREAMGNLEVVETRLREANLVLGEKIGMLNELEREREVALKYQEQKRLHNNARGSIIKKEMARLEADMAKAINDLQKISNSLKGKRADLAELEVKIRECEGKRGSLLSEIQARQQQNALTKTIETLKLSISREEQEAEEKRRLSAKLESEIAALKEETKKDSEGVKKTEAELKKADEDLAAIKLPKEGAAKLLHESRMKKAVEEQRQKISLMREQLIRLEGDIKSAEQLLLEKERSIDEPERQEAERPEKLSGEIEVLKREVGEARAQLDSMFEREKEANAEIADVERRMLSIREKIAALRAQNPRLGSNAVLEFMSTLKHKDSDVHGTLIDLISFDSKYANAVEASAGPRLLYLVVSDANVATRMISRIKEAGVGRATFIPLREVKPAPISSSEGLGPLSNFIKCEARVQRAVDYAFGDTLLVSTMEDAKKIGLGKYRMVTLDGEIFEKSGVITGGRTKTGIAAAGALAKLETELGELKAERESLTSELTSLRESMSSLRSARAEKEVRAKSLEVELGAMRSEEERAKKANEEAEKKKEEIALLNSKLRESASRKSALERELASLSEKMAKDEKSLADEEQQLARQNEEMSKKHTELVARASALQSRRESLAGELELRKTNLHKLELSIRKMAEEKASHLSCISESERKLSSQKDELQRKEHELASSSKELESLFKRMKEAEEASFALSQQKGALSAECEKLARDQEVLNLKKATAETKLADLKAEFDSFREFVFMDMGKEELLEISKSADAFLNEHQNVNLASIELYDKKKAEVGDVRDKMEKLKQEKEAIIKMMEQIDSRKKETFFATFYAVNDNFRKMFKYIPQVGEGYLYLDKPNEPFESGLFMKIKRGAKETGLELLSGGEISLITLMFIFALQFVKPSPYYVLDEVDSALDKENSKNLAKLVKEMSKNSQFIMVTHNDTVMTFASAVFGVSRSDGVSKVVGVKLEEKIDSASESKAGQ